MNDVVSRDRTVVHENPRDLMSLVTIEMGYEILLSFHIVNVLKVLLFASETR